MMAVAFVSGFLVAAIPVLLFVALAVWAANSDDPYEE